MAGTDDAVTFVPMEREEFIQHYGIKGMKWGKRKSKDGASSKSSTPKLPSVADRKAAVSKMSDAELRSKINRIQMEKQYLDLTAPKTSAGKNEVKKILLNTAKQQLSQAASKYAAKAIEDAVKAAAK